ncbi:MAG: SAM-dependent methyltransferase [Planctomycetota bacterium]
MTVLQHRILLVLLSFAFCVSPSLAAANTTTSDKTPDCVYVPTPHDVVEKMLEMADIQKDDVVYDLGCGDGRIVVQAAKKRGCKGVGFEIVPELVEKARENIRKNDVEHLVEIKTKDLYKTDISKATVLPIYLLPKMLKKLKPKLAKLKRGTRIVSHDYRIEGVIPDKEVEMVSKETGAEHILILYTLPFKETE